MQNAIKTLTIIGLAAIGLAACSKQSSPDQNILIDTNVPAGAEIEALPPDEGNGAPVEEPATNAGNETDGDLTNSYNAL
ncbi:MAG: hypothetical protein ACREBP_03345 [Sphingomicrobium sp.]